MRQIVLDTETTGLEPSEGHRVIEIGCIEVIDRKLTGHDYHQYLQPDREIDIAAQDVHGIRDTDLGDKPRFAEIAEDFLKYIAGAELIIHNAAFDVAFLDYELSLLTSETKTARDYCQITDTLELARGIHPGQKNSLDALCKRYNVDNSTRDFHGALQDARILAEVYLAMTGGQVSLSLSPDAAVGGGVTAFTPLPADRQPLPVIRASEAESAAHEQRLREIDEASGGKCLWLAS